VTTDEEENVYSDVWSYTSKPYASMIYYLVKNDYYEVWSVQSGHCPTVYY